MKLATEAIKQAIADGAIVCNPAPEKIEGAHIDVRLGEHFWTFAAMEHEVIDLRKADPHNYFFAGAAQDGFIVLPGYGRILAHTEEYIGTAPGTGLVPMLHTRSTFARWHLGVCTANAGQGDEGYATRWTLEIINPHPNVLLLPVGGRIGSLSFDRTEGTANPYQPGTRYNLARAEWTPLAMLPRKGNW